MGDMEPGAQNPAPRIGVSARRKTRVSRLLPVAGKTTRRVPGDSGAAAAALAEADPDLQLRFPYKLILFLFQLRYISRILLTKYFAHQQFCNEGTG